MLGSLARHSLVAVLLAIIVEELGIPMSTPTNLMIAYVGADRPPSQLVLLFGLLALSSAIGASGLYAIVRRGGRPLVDRFGRYVLLGRSSSPAARRYSRVAAGEVSLSGALSQACATLRSSPVDSSESLTCAS